MHYRSLQMFERLRAILSRTSDIEQLIALCVHVTREETLRTAEYKIAQVRGGGIESVLFVDSCRS